MLKPRYRPDTYLFQIEDHQGYCPEIPDWIDQSMTIRDALRIYRGDVTCMSYFSESDAADLLNDYGDEIISYLNREGGLERITYDLASWSWDGICRHLVFQAVYAWVCWVIDSYDLHDL